MAMAIKIPSFSAVTANSMARFSHFSFWVLMISLYLLVLAGSPASGEGKISTKVRKQFSFPNFSVDNDPRTIHDVKLLGSAMFSNQNAAVRIPDDDTLDLRHQAGRAIYSSPIRLLDPLSHTPASFHTTFSFQFITNLISNDHNDENGGGGSGLTFIFVPDEFTVGRPGPWLGMLNDACENDYKAVAVEFDTHLNPEFGDPNDNHVGINLGSIVSAKAFNASDVGVFLHDGSVHRAWISYDGPRRWMDIRLASDGWDYPPKPVFSGFLDISPFLKEYMFVGFSASTGTKSQIHNVLSWNFSSTSQASLRVPPRESCETKILVRNSRSANQTVESESKTKTPHSFIIFVVVVASVLGVAVIVALICHFRGKRKDKLKSLIMSEKKQRPRPPNKPRRYTLSEISSATRGFNDLELLGSDSRGVYYRGKLPNGCLVAVKRLSTEFLTSKQGLGFDKKRFLKEIAAISRVRHPNLVPIRGWCYDNGQLMIVYDFNTNGSLDKWLFGAGVLPWTRRLKVIKDVAEALGFLHSKLLAHKNMKTTSVFLDVSFRAMLGDFGFVLLANESRRFESLVSQKADVFEFGVFVLEVVSGRRRLDREVNRANMDLVEFAWRMHESGEKGKVVDGRMGSLVNMEQAIRVVEIGLLCTMNEDKGRPAMEELLEFLTMKREIPELPSRRPLALFPYNSATGLCNGYSCSTFK